MSNGHVYIKNDDLQKGDVLRFGDGVELPPIRFLTRSLYGHTHISFEGVTGDIVLAEGWFSPIKEREPEPPVVGDFVQYQSNYDDVWRPDEDSSRKLEYVGELAGHHVFRPVGAGDLLQVRKSYKLRKDQR